MNRSDPYGAPSTFYLRLTHLGEFDGSATSRGFYIAAAPVNLDRPSGGFEGHRVSGTHKKRASSRDRNHLAARRLNTDVAASSVDMNVATDFADFNRAATAGGPNISTDIVQANRIPAGADLDCP